MLVIFPGIASLRQNAAELELPDGYGAHDSAS
jgi:hypothetical protein